jgi:hypothetical protein
VTAVVELEPGLWASNIAQTEEVSLPEVYFLAGTEKSRWHYEDLEKALVLRQVDAVVLSETLADLTAAAVRAK